MGYSSRLSDSKPKETPPCLICDCSLSHHFYQLRNHYFMFVKSPHCMWIPSMTVHSAGMYWMYLFRRAQKKCILHICISYCSIITISGWLNSVKSPSFILKPACFMLKPPFFTRSAAGEKFNHPPRINPHSSLAQVCNMVVPVSGRICATSLDFGPFCLGQRKMLSPKFSALAC